MSGGRRRKRAGPSCYSNSPHSKRYIHDDEMYIFNRERMPPIKRRLFMKEPVWQAFIRRFQAKDPNWQAFIRRTKSKTPWKNLMKLNRTKYNKRSYKKGSKKSRIKKGVKSRIQNHVKNYLISKSKHIGNLYAEGESHTAGCMAADVV